MLASSPTSVCGEAVPTSSCNSKEYKLPHRPLSSSTPAPAKQRPDSPFSFILFSHLHLCKVSTWRCKILPNQEVSILHPLCIGARQWRNKPTMSHSFILSLHPDLVRWLLLCYSKKKQVLACIALLLHIRDQTWAFCKLISISLTYPYCNCTEVNGVTAGVTWDPPF